jgi:PAS domain S-box-containing protein
MVDTEKDRESASGDWDLAVVDARRQLFQLIERMPDGVAVVRDGILLYVNVAWARLLGFASPRDLVGTPLTQWVDAGERARLEEREIIEPSERRELRFLRRGGEPVMLELIPIQVIDLDGLPSRMLGARDVTAQKKMKERILLADRLVTLGTLAAGIAHEINNPLAYMMANLGFLGEEAAVLAEELPAGRLNEFRHVLQEVQSGANRVRNIVRDLRLLSRKDEGELEPVDVRRLLDSSINMVWNEIQHRARLVKRYESVPTVVTNPSRLGQVFINLLVNAAHAIPEGFISENEITLVTRGDERGWAVVEVRDTGCGIPAENLERIFEPFFTTKSAETGTGLGLHISKNTITSLGGEMAVESALGEGTTFRVWLPPQQGTLVSPSPAEPVARAAEARARVLVVDDEPLFGASVRRLLRGHEVILAGSGREALEICRKNGTSFDLVICDLIMADLSGMDFFDIVREEWPGFERRIVFVTGGVFTDRSRAFIQSVSNRVFEKPIDASTLRLLAQDAAHAGQ